MRIDLAAIDRTQFHVNERNGQYLVKPHKNKTVFTEEERPLRSLLTDAHGRVLSAGYPRFPNYGEYPADDADFRYAVASKQVDYTDKLDGTLIILSFVDRQPHMRTRGSFDLGTFSEPVMALIAEKYPRLFEWYTGDSFYARLLRNDYSVLFEYTAPTNRIVLKYEEASLTTLGLVWHSGDRLQVSTSRAALDAIALTTGVPAVKERALPEVLTEALDLVRNLSGEEGVVGSFPCGTEGRRLIKIKARDYVRLHALKSRLEGKVAKLAFLLGVGDVEDGVRKLMDMGVDFETSTFVMPELEAFVRARHEVLRRYQYLVYAVERIAGVLFAGPDPKAARKAAVEQIRAVLAEEGIDERWFPVAMKLVDNNTDEAWLMAQATFVMGESPNTVRQWAKNTSLAVTEMLSAPVVED